MSVCTAAVFLVGLFLPNMITKPFYLTIANEGLLLGMVAVSIGFLKLQSGVVVFGASAFYGGTAYLFAIATMSFEWPAAAAAAFALAGSVGVAFVVGALICNAKPLSFMMLTLAIAEMLHRLATIAGLRPLTGGDDGITINFPGTLLGLSQADFSDASTFWIVGWTTVACVMAVVWMVGQSRWGKILRATRENEERMRFSGFNTYYPRLFAFVLSSAIAALAGLLAVLKTGFVSPELLDMSTSSNGVIAALIGGVGSVGGPLFGGLLYTFALDQFGARGHLQLFTGLAVVIVVSAFPTGFAGLTGLLIKRLRW